MSNRFKALGGVIVVAFTLAIGVNTASATTANFGSIGYPATLSGGTTLQLFTETGELLCLGETSGELAAKSASISLAPKYNACVLGAKATTPTMEGCTYTLVAGTLIFGGSEGWMNVVCPSEKEMKFTAGNCVISIPPTSESGPVTYENEEEAEDRVFARIKVGLKYSMNNKCGPAEGTYKGLFLGLFEIRSSNLAVWVRE